MVESVVGTKEEALDSAESKRTVVLEGCSSFMVVVEVTSFLRLR